MERCGNKCGSGIGTSVAGVSGAGTVEHGKTRRGEKRPPRSRTWKPTGITGSSITRVRALSTALASLIALLLTLLQDGEESRKPGVLEGLLEGAFSRYLRLITSFGLGVAASLLRFPRPAAPRSPCFLHRLSRKLACPLLVGAWRSRGGRLLST